MPSRQKKLKKAASDAAENITLLFLNILFFRIFLILPIPPLKFLRLALLMLCKIHGAAVYIQRTPVLLESLFQTVQMVQLLRISSFKVCNAANTDILHVPLHLCTDPRNILQITAQAFIRPFFHANPLLPVSC